MVVRFLFLAVALAVLAEGTPGFAQVTNESIQKSIGKGVKFVRENLNGKEGGGGEVSLAAYALIKSGDDPNSRDIKIVLDELAVRAKTSNYSPGSHGIYSAGVELMLLEAAGGAKYQQQIQNIVDYLVKQQHSSGGWDYVNGWRGGDTSQCQYALLGFWAAERAGVKVPVGAWDKAAQWFLRSQARDGGFTYHPYGDRPQVDLVTTHAMSAAGAGGLLITKMYLYPNEKVGGPKQPKPSKVKFGVLETVNLDAEELPDGSSPANPSDDKPTVSSAALQDAANRASAWVANRFTVKNEITSTGHLGAYYLYTLERMAALLDAREIAGHDWYREGAAYLIETQNPATGSWKSSSGEFATTSLALLFLLKTTSKILHRDVPLDPLGTGLLAGGRGLPDDLNQAIVKDGKVESVKDLGPIDQLLAELDKVESVDIPATQSAIIEQVQLGDREELIKQKDRLLKLAKHPSAEIRRTAIWALGRTEDLKVARLLIAALDENDVDVMVEARNALCILSRKPLGFGLPESPYQGLAENATDQEKQAAVKLWREKVKGKWAAWYYKYRPYEERDDLSEALFRLPK